MARIALVTGANQGIGLEIVRELCKKFDGTVLLAARSPQRGEEARKKLESENLHPRLILLDIDSKESILEAKDIVEKEYGRLDVLVNNAAVFFPPDSELNYAERAFRTIRTNYHGLAEVTEAFGPLLQPNSRIINMSASIAQLKLLGPRRQKQILDPELTVEGLTALMDEYVEDAKSSEDFDAKGWAPDKESPPHPSFVSKIAVFRLTELLVATIGKEVSKKGILINSVCPGWVKTQMGSTPMGTTLARSVEKGAETAVYLALLAPGTTDPNGLSLNDKVPFEWK